MIDFDYSENMASGVVGAIVNTEPNTLVSYNVETVDGIGFGLPVSQGAADRSCKAMASGDTEVIGFTVADRTTAPSDDNPDTFLQHDSARVMRKGVIWVTVDDSGGVVPGDEVWVALANGQLSNADLGSGGSLQLQGCRWETSAGDGELAQLRVNLDVPAVAGAPEVT